MVKATFRWAERGWIFTRRWRDGTTEIGLCGPRRLYVPSLETDQCIFHIPSRGEYDLVKNRSLPFGGRTALDHTIS